MEFTLGQQKAMALASARARASESETPQQETNTPVGGLQDAILEPLVNMATGYVAKPIGEVTGLARMGINSLIGDRSVDPGELSNTVRNALTYEPKTQVGQSDSNLINKVNNAIGSAVHSAQFDNPDEGTDLEKAGKRGWNELVPQAAGILGAKFAPQISSAVGYVPKTIINGAIKGGGNVINSLTKSGINRVAEKIVNDTAGGDASRLAGLLQNAPEGVTAGQAGVDASNRTFSALDQFGRQTAPNEAGRMIDAQKAQSLANLIRNGAAPTMEDQLALNRLMKYSETDPVIQNYLKPALSAADQVNVTLSRLEPQLEQARNAATAGVQGVRDMTAAEQRARDIANNTNKPLGEVRVPGNLTYMGEKGGIADRAANAAQQGADMSLQQGEQARFIESQIGSLESHGKPLNTDIVRKEVKNALKSDEASADKKFELVMISLDEQLSGLNTHPNGGVTSGALYHFKKTGVRSAIETALKDDPTITQETISRYAAKISPLIDKALDTASGGEWTPYNKMFSSAMDKVNSVRLAGEMRNLYENNPTEFERVANGADPAFVNKITGFEKLDEADPSGANVYRQEAQKLKTNRRLKEMSAEGGSAASKIIGGEEILPSGPHILSHKIALYNSALNALRGKSTPAVAERIATIMRDPPLAAQILRKGIENKANSQARLSTYNDLTQATNPLAYGVMMNPNNIAKKLREGASQ